MVARGVPVGLVTGIRGNMRHPRAVCRGQADHSGAVPRWLRHDAVFATSELVMRLDRHWQALLEQGQDLVLTFGILGTNPAEHAMSRVPGEVRFSLEYRSQSDEVLGAFGKLVGEEAAAIGRARGVSFDLGPGVPTPPAVMDAALVDHLAEICGAQAIPYERMPSGAGHDTAIFANEGVSTAMIFVRNEHGSHNPREAMDFADFFLGAEVLFHYLLTAPEALV
jgi:N-carbamoyl-L-amino-acid hydrolase